MQEKKEADFGSFPGGTIIVHHAKPRTTMFVAKDGDCLTPIKYIDVMRRIYTDLDSMAEHVIEDTWTEDGAKELSSPWKGKTVVFILRPPAPPGYRWVEGRITKSQQTSPPDSVRPGIWQTMSKKQKRKEIARWEARNKRGIIEVSVDDKDCLKTMSEARAKLSQPKAPAMPIFSVAAPSVGEP
jgi:hypothetical protein